MSSTDLPNPLHYRDIHNFLTGPAEQTGIFHSGLFCGSQATRYSNVTMLFKAQGLLLPLGIERRPKVKQARCC